MSILIGEICPEKDFKLKIGENCRLKNNNYGSEPFNNYGNHVSAINVDFITHDGRLVMERRNSNIDFFKPITLESNIFIGQAIILPGTHIESNVILVLDQW